MNSEQVMGLIRLLLTTFGSMAVTFGWLAPDKVASVTATLLAIAGPAMILVSTIWTMVSHTNTNIVTAAANVPEVSHITLQPTPTGVAMGQATPPNVRIAP